MSLCRVQWEWGDERCWAGAGESSANNKRSRICPRSVKAGSERQAITRTFFQQPSAPPGCLCAHSLQLNMQPAPLSSSNTAPRNSFSSDKAVKSRQSFAASNPMRMSVVAAQPRLSMAAGTQVCDSPFVADHLVFVFLFFGFSFFLFCFLSERAS